MLIATLHQLLQQRLHGNFIIKIFIKFLKKFHYAVCIISILWHLIKKYGNRKRSKRTKRRQNSWQLTNIEDTIRQIKTKFGEDAIMKLGDKPRVDVDAIPTGSIGLILPWSRWDASRTYY